MANRVFTSVSIPQEPTENDTLEHHGVKGMKWGVRKAHDGVYATSRAQTKVAKAVGSSAVNNAKKAGSGAVTTAKAVGSAAKTTGKVSAKVGKATIKGAKITAFAFNANSQHTVNRIVSDAHKNFKATDLKTINAKPEYVKASKVGNRLKNPLDPTTKAYRAEAKTAYIKQLEKSANSIHGVNGQYRYTVKDYDYRTQKTSLPTSKYAWQVSIQKRPGVHHAAVSTVDNGDLSGTFLVNITLDANGLITDISPAEVPLQQSTEAGIEFLRHMGITVDES